MSSIDDRVVQLQFDNKQFEAGVKTTLDSLSALKNGLKLEGATKGLEDVEAAGGKFSLAGIGRGVDDIANRFKALSVIGISALATLASQAVNVGETMARKFFGPAKDGLSEYETNLNAIQTILSNTAWQNTGLNDVNAALNNLNHYSDLTIYNFSEMARNIGTFTAAGVKLQTSVDAIKGIANLAAISGSSADQASTAMYQLSQALATGTLKLQDWNSVVNAGMGGKVFQDALKETARAHGVAVDKIIKDEGSFRDSLQKGWLTSQILTETLSKFTGDLTAAQLKTMGYNDQQIAGILKMGKDAQDAATKVKTFSQLMNTLQESAGSGWASTWQLIFGDFGEAKDLFTGVYNVLNGFISASSNARNKVLGDWKELGGRKDIIYAISNAFYALIAVVKPIKDAFREIFPAVTGKQLADLSFSLLIFSQKLKIGADTAEKLKRTFAGVFAVLGIVKDVIVDVVKLVFNFAGAATSGSGSVLNFTAKVGDFLVKLKGWLEQGDRLNNAIKTLGAILLAPIAALKLLAQWIGDAFGKVDVNATPAVDRIQASLETFGTLGDRLAKIWGAIVKAFNAVKDALTPAAKAIGDFFKSLGKAIQDTFSGNDIDFSGFLDAINTGLFVGLVLLLKKFFKNGLKLDFGNGVFDALKESLDGLTGTFEAMQTKLKADALIKIAIAIGLLTVSVVALSLINSDKLTIAVTAMGVMFIELASTMQILDKMTSTKGIAKLPLITASLILLAIAIDLLTISVVTLSKLSWNDLAKGLVGLTVMLEIVIATVDRLPNDAKLFEAALGLAALGFAIKILVSAVTDLAGLSWEEMARGLTGVAILLTSLGLFAKFTEVGKGSLLQDTGLLLMAAAINLLANATATFAKQPWASIAKGLATMGAALSLIGLALKLMSKDSNPKDTLASAASVLIVAGAMEILAIALGKMGGMSWEQIAKSLVVLAGSLIIIGDSMDAMTEALPGAAALLIVVASLAILLPVLKAMGDMSWTEIGKSMLVLVGVFVIFGVAALALTEVVPIMIALGLAVALLGIGFLAAGAGVFLFALGLTALAAAGAAGTAALVFMVQQMIGLIPYLLEQVALGLVAFANVVAQSGPAFTAAITTVLLSFITSITTMIPTIVEALLKLLLTLLETLVNYIPKLVDAGYKLLIGILEGIAKNIGGVVKAATDVIVNFLKGISDNQPRIIQAGFDLIINFINGIANAIRNNSKAMGEAGGNLATAIVEGMVNGLWGGVGKIVSAAKGVAKSALDAAMHLLGINSPSKEFVKVGQWSSEGMAIGLTNYAGVVAKSAENVGMGALDAMRNSISGLSNIVSGEMDNIQPIVTPVLDLSDIKKNAGQISKVLSGTVPISTQTSFSQASDAFVGFQNNRPGPDDPGAMVGGGVSFTQNNYSPKALSSADIYRQTNNQLSKVKEVVKPNA